MAVPGPTPLSMAASIASMDYSSLFSLIKVYAIKVI
jgi:hypothetical protein